MTLTALLPCTLLIGTLFPAGPIPAPTSQEATQEVRSVSSHGDPSAMVMVNYYSPIKAPVETLANTMIDLHRHFHPSTELGSFRFRSYGNTLLVQGHKNRMEGVLSQVQTLDERYTSIAPAAREISFVHHLKYLQPDTALLALRYLTSQGGGMPTDGVSFRVTSVSEPQALILSGAEHTVAQARTILEELDILRPRLMLTCYLVQGTATDSSPGLPASLVRDLSSLVPAKNFELMARGMLPSDGSREMDLDVDVEGKGGRVRVSLKPGGYDQVNGVLSLSRVDFTIKLNYLNEDAEVVNVQRSFTTSTSVKTDEYTVLGAVGSNPMFLVVELKHLGS